MTTSSTPIPQPVVIHPIELASFIQHLLSHHAPPTNLIVCSSQDSFLQQLLASTAHEKDDYRQEAENEALDPVNVSRIAAQSHSLLIPTIYQLSTSRTITVTFCATLAQLQAYIGTYSLKKPPGAAEEKTDSSKNGAPTLALLNPLQLHHNTSSFSAQGLSRTFASAVEAATRRSQQLVIAECPSRTPAEAVHSSVPSTQAEEDEVMELIREETGGADPWEQEVSILNVTTKSFGVGERGWVGRTVQVKRIVGRWCVFEQPET